MVPAASVPIFLICLSMILRPPILRITVNMPRILPILLFLPLAAQPVPNIKDVLKCPQTPSGAQPYTRANPSSGDLRKITIDAPNAVCNDGSSPLIYVRPAREGATEPDGPSANRWVIHLLGGSSCSSYEECAARWCGIGKWEGTLMTTNFEGDFRSPDGLLNRGAANRIADRNLVLVKYCSSDQWQGRKSNVVLRAESDPSKAFSLHFQGATIVNAVLDLLERGVPGLPRLTAATDVLFSGDSAGANGARAHLDRVAARLRAANPGVRVRGHFEATFDPDLNGKQGFPAGDPRDPVFPNKTARFNTIHVEQRNSQLDDSCLAAHPAAPYLCADSGYLTLNHISTPFFQLQDIQDQLLINAYQENGFDKTDAELAAGLHDQLTDLSKLPHAAAVSRNCRVHVAWSDDDGFLGKRIAPGLSYYDLLWNFLTGASPSGYLGTRPPLSPNPPAIDPTCNARASTSPALPAVVVVSSASYELNAPVAPDSIVAAFGANLANQPVTVTDSRNTTRTATVFYSSPNQLLFLIPTGTAPGLAQVAVGAQRGAFTVAPTAPSIYTVTQDGNGVAAGTWVRVNRAGVRSEGLLANGVPAAAGDQIYLVLYGTGMRYGPATATVGGIEVPVAGPVAQGQYAGLDQINLGPLPLRGGYGTKEIVIRQGAGIANVSTVTFRP